MIKALLLVLALALTEAQHCEIIAKRIGAEQEVVLWDRTRVDLLTDEYAIEVDWARKWAEGIGQALYYSVVTGRKPAVILLATKTNRDFRFIYRAQTVCAGRGIKLFVEWVESKPKKETVR